MKLRWKWYGETGRARHSGEIDIAAGRRVQDFLPAPDAAEKFLACSGAARGYEADAVRGLGLEHRQIHGQGEELLVDPQPIRPVSIRDRPHARQNARIGQAQARQESGGRGRRFQAGLRDGAADRFHEARLEEHAQCGHGLARVDVHRVGLAMVENQEGIGVHQQLAAIGSAEDPCTPYTSFQAVTCVRWEVPGSLTSVSSVAVFVARAEW